VKKPFDKKKRQKNFLKPLFSNNKQFKSSDINILLNRVKLNEKLEFRKKILSVIGGIIATLLFAVIFLY
tara:strand:+ start:456 stop:662 length:207 start_codon:yes stop_codon:yes gene_type:complete